MQRRKQQQIESLKELEDSGYIDLFFWDESHFGLTPNVPYAWQTKDNPILLPAAKGKFLNVVDLMNRKNDLFFLKCMNRHSIQTSLSVLRTVLSHRSLKRLL